MAYPVGRFFEFAPIPWAATTLLGPLFVVGVVHFVFKSLATNAAREWQQPFSHTAAKASGAIRSASQSGKREFESALERLATQHQQNQRLALEEKEEKAAAAEQAFRRRRQRLESLFRRRLKELEADWEKQCQTAKSQIHPQLELAKQQLEQSKADRTSLFQQQSRELDDRLQHDTKRLHQTWQTANDDFQKMLVETLEVAQRHESSLAEMLNDAWHWPTQPPAAVPFAKVALPVMTLDVDSAASESKQIVLPAMLSYPEHGSLLIDTGRGGQQVASQLMRHVMLRILANFPPGKVRFTIIDPVGLGQDFSALMHLADYDELLVHSRIWTDSSHISQRLADLTQHMENVIQKYLRNEFQSIQQYNQHAGEVAEPFQILVIANFPTSFSDEAQRRLASICASGAKCGVYTLISYAGNDTLPKNFAPNSLEEHANVLCWDEATSSFRWKEESLHPFPVEIGPSPDEQTVTEFLKRAGQQALRDNRVEVAFEKVAPTPSQIWRESSANELNVALGRAGATKLQTLSLGHGTSQHVLISGKTGSGKSTLLHALITNLALHYSPAEVQFYLIDFKKGVEFKPYADLQLPHARVIAIESEREFGMSVLENLDQELRRRGDLFRQAGVQSLAAFREANSAEPMPRLLLIVDEFQEFFVNDDRISHDASLLLDRIVRQGRAFGMHVVLGSQTLAGAYSLARSTIGQMGIRIALQCSEADSHLILSEDNNAARLLNRPGEAIYNDTSGTVEGNSLFQVVWLTDQQRHSYLQQLTERASCEFVHLPSPIVFEGNAAAALDANPYLLGADQEEAERTVAWLGDPVAIKEPTHVRFGRQHGTNLLLSGQSPELAMGIVSAAMLSLIQPASTDVNGIARFVVLDGLRADTGETLFGDRLAQHFPEQIQVVGPNGADKAMRELADELKRRQDDPETRYPSTFW
ncbi:MAG: FtsK/SpoIIIE domain-containing protein [Pirellulaceae bacterium]